MAFVRSDLSKPAVPYVHQEFPKMVYHATEPPRVVPDDAAWAALGAAWGYPQAPPAVDADFATVTEPDGGMVLELPRKRRRRG